MKVNISYGILMLLGILISFVLHAYEKIPFSILFLNFSFVVLTILFKPYSSELIVSPKNLIFVFFLVSMCFAPLLLYLYGSYLSVWIDLYNKKFWSHISIASYVWFLNYFFYCIGLSFSKSKIIYNQSFYIKPSGTNTCSRLPQSILLSSIILVILGVVGLIIAAGSISELFSVLGIREKALEIIGVSGNGRFLIWSPGISIGVALIFQYTIIKKNLSYFSAKLLGWMLYLMFTPFYLFSSGRGNLILPALLLIFVYEKRFGRLRLVKLVPWIIGIPISFAIFSVYRQDGILGLDDINILRALVYTIMDSFSRFDVSAAAISGWIQEDIEFQKGYTYLTGLLQFLPPWIVDLRADGGTSLLAKAVYVDKNYDEPSGLASVYFFEAYANFGVFGMIISSFMLGWLIHFLHAGALKGQFMAIFFMIFSFQVPYAVAFQIGVAGVFWQAIFPLTAYKITHIFVAYFIKPLNGKGTA